jgi:hypothetical protein
MVECLHVNRKSLLRFMKASSEEVVSNTQVSSFGVIFRHFSRFFLRWERQGYTGWTYGATIYMSIFCESMNQWLRMHLKCEISGLKTCWAWDRDYHIQSNFWKFYVMRTSFTLGELVFFGKCLDCLDWKGFFLGVHSVDTVGTCTTSYLLAGPACLWCLVMLWNRPWKNHHHLKQQQLTLPGSPHTGWNWACSIVKRKKKHVSLFKSWNHAKLVGIDYRCIDL